MSETSCYLLPMSTGRPPSKVATDFGKRVAEARRQRGLTQRQLADQLGVSQKMVDYFERRAENVVVDAGLHRRGDRLRFLHGGVGEVEVQRHPDPRNGTLSVRLDLEPMQFVILA